MLPGQAQQKMLPAPAQQLMLPAPAQAAQAQAQAVAQLQQQAAAQEHGLLQQQIAQQAQAQAEARQRQQAGIQLTLPASDPAELEEKTFEAPTTIGIPSPDLPPPPAAGAAGIMTVPWSPEKEVEIVSAGPVAVQRAFNLPQLIVQAIRSNLLDEAARLEQEFQGFMAYLQKQRVSVPQPGQLAILPRQIGEAAVSGDINRANQLKNQIAVLGQWAGQRGIVYSKFTGGVSDWYTRPLMEGDLPALGQVTRVTRDPETFKTQTYAGAQDVSQLPSGRLAMLKPIPGVQVAHPTLAPPFTGPKPDHTGMVDMGKEFTTTNIPTGRELVLRTDPLDPEVERVPPSGPVVVHPGLEPEVEVVGKPPRELVPTALPTEYDYGAAFQALKPDVQESINMIIDRIAKHIHEGTLAQEDKGKTVHGAEFLSGDVCKQILDELNKLLRDPGNTTIKANVVRLMRAIASSIPSSGTLAGAIRTDAEKLMRNNPTPEIIRAINTRVQRACTILDRLAKKVGVGMESVRGTLWGGPEVHDRSQQMRRHKDFGKAQQAKDREDMQQLSSTEPSRVTNPRDQSFAPVPDLDMSYLPGFTAPIMAATPEQLKQPGRSDAETKYKWLLKYYEKFTLESLKDPKERQRLVGIYKDTQLLANQYGFPKVMPIAHDQKSLVERLKTEAQEVKSLTAMARQNAKQKKQYSAIAASTTADIKQNAKDIKRTQGLINKSAKQLTKASAQVRSAQAAHNKKPTGKTSSKLTAATNAQSAAQQAQQKHLGDLRTQTNRSAALHIQKDSAQAAVNLASATKSAIQDRKQNITQDMKLIKANPNLVTAEARRRTVANRHQQGFIDREANRRVAAQRSFENLGVELEATHSEEAAWAERRRQAAARAKQEAATKQAQAQKDKENKAAMKEREAMKQAFEAKHKKQQEFKAGERSEFKAEAARKRREARHEEDEKIQGRDSPFRHELQIVPKPKPISSYENFMQLPDLPELQSILEAGKWTGRIDMKHRKEIIDVIRNKLQNWMDYKGIPIHLPPFDKHELTKFDKVKTMDIRFVRENTLFDKISMPVAARLLRIAGYNRDVVEKLIKFAPVKKGRTKSKTAIASLVQKHKGPRPHGTGRPLPQDVTPATVLEMDVEEPKPKPAKPRPKPRSTSPKPGPKPLPKMETRVGDRSKTPRGDSPRRGRRRRSKSRSRSPTRRRKSGSPKRAKSPGAKRRTKSHGRVPVGTPSPFLKPRRP